MMSAAALNEIAVLVTKLAKPIGAMLFATELAKPIGTVFPADDEVAKGLTFESSSES